MRFQETITEIKSRIDLKQLAGELGVRHKGSGWLCPFHPDRNPSLSISREYFKCFACGAKGDAFEMVSRATNRDFHGALEFLASLTGVHLPTFKIKGPCQRLSIPSPSVRSSSDDKTPIMPDSRRVLIYTEFAGRARLQKTTSPDHFVSCYLRNRGISATTAIACGLGGVPDYKRARDYLLYRIPLADLQGCGLFNSKGNFRLFKHRLLIPYWLNGEAFTIQARNTTWRNKELDGPKEMTIGPISIPFNADALLEPKDHVFVCEGAIDALSLIELGFPAVGIPGASSFKPNWVSLFDEIKEVFLALDNDEAGRNGAEAIAGHFAKHGRTVKVLEFPRNIKDVNEFLNSHTNEEDNG